MKANIARFPVFINGSGLADEPGPSQAISVLLPGLDNDGVSFLEDCLVLPESSLMRPVQRLVVLVPENELNENELARRIWKLAAPGSLSILLLSISSSPQTETYLRRRLATLALITGDEQVHVNTMVVPNKNWIKAVENVRRSDDLLVCYNRHAISNWVFDRRNLGMQLSKAMDTPVYFLGGLKLGQSLRQRKLLNNLIVWPTAISIIVAFGWLEIQIDQAMNGWISTIILIIIVLVEIMILYILNTITS